MQKNPPKLEKKKKKERQKRMTKQEIKKLIIKDSALERSPSILCQLIRLGE